jgi:signal transduction histidine kinase
MATQSSILVVDDDAAVVDTLREILEEAGYRVTTAGSGRQALTALERFTPQLVVSDIRMPEMDGYRLYAEVRARPQYVGLPFIFLSGLGGEADIREGRKMGVDDYLVKPVGEADLLAAVRGRLERRAQLEGALERQLDEVKRSILSTLNHEFRTPLTYLTGYAEMLRESAPEGELLRQSVDGVLEGAKRLRGLVEDLLMLVDLQSGMAQRVFEREKRLVEDLPGILRAALAEEEPRASARGVRLAAEIPSELPAFHGHRELLSQAVTRLLDNAIKFSKKEGGRVVLSAKAIARHVAIAVADEGIGMPAEELGKISSMFYQIDRARMEQQGSGSGLTIVQGIVTMHGGTLTVTSEVGVGSTFRIDLPRSSSEER